MRIDTHVHSNHSDGRSSVRQIFSLAKRVNLDVIALTDHDTNSGWQQAQYYSKIKQTPESIELTIGRVEKD